MAQGIWVMEKEEDPTRLFAPVGSRAIGERDYTTGVFGWGDRRVTVILVSNFNQALSAKAFAFLQKIHDAIVHSPGFGGHTFASVCARSYFPFEALDLSATDISQCKRMNGPLLLFENDFNSGVYTDADVLRAVNNASLWAANEPAGPPLSYYLSQVGLVTEDDVITSARAVRMDLSLKNDREGDDVYDQETHEFELGVVDALLASFKPSARSHGFEIEIVTYAEVLEASNSAIADDMSVLVLGYVLMIFFTCFVLSRARAKYSHSVLGLASVCSVGMSTLTAYGLCWYIGLKFNAVVQVLILVLLGVGIDDTFVIMDSWCDFAHERDMKTRMIKAMGHAGPAITVTSVTDLVAFLAGSSTVMPALQMFCYYATVGILFDFVFQVTFFVSIAYLDSERQAANRRDLICCAHADDHDGWCGQLCVAHKDEPVNETNRGLLHKLAGEQLPNLLLGSNVWKIAVLAVTGLLLAMGVWGCIEVKMNYNTEWFAPDGHHFKDVIALRSEYFGGKTLPAQLISKTLDYPTSQKLLVDSCRALGANKWVVPGSVDSWLLVFQAWVSTTYPQSLDASAPPGYTLVHPDQFYPLLKQWLSRTGPPSAVKYTRSVAWVDSTNPASTLLATRVSFVIVGGPLDDGEEAVDCLRDLRSTTDPYDAFPFTRMFLFWEAYAIFFQEITRNVGVAAVCVLVIVSLLEASFATGALVVFTVGCVDVCMLGYMTWIGVDVNGISIICIVVAIGLAVDYSVHIASAFLTVSANPVAGHSAKAQRAAYSMWKMAPAVLNGGMSTFIAVSPLIFAKSYVFQVFIRMFFLIIVFGLWFGVLVLPILLSLIGPQARLGATPLEEVPRMNPLDPRFRQVAVASYDPSTKVEVVQ
eukprot:TRINITY_DN2599_c0_g1_i5.p1 TRINITY_DN2599_c0_g1~~TRINITY_DN2599_c0_g1_i5.p1  ORF type:complete len:914 (+),score=275.03 TRINITY_DN2599_c0_g1_i5:132-2744(+)